MNATMLALYTATALALIVMPGPDMVYVLTQGVARGRRVAGLSVAGICLGYGAHTLLAALGVSALVASSPEAFQIVRWLGTAYLVYLGVRALRDRSGFLPDAAVADVAPGSVVRQGVLTSTLNPKGILFFLSFLPQFVVPGAAPVPLQVAAFGLAFTLLCALVYGAVGLSAGAVGDRLRRSPRLSNALRWLTGSVLIGLGVRLLIHARH